MKQLQCCKLNFLQWRLNSKYPLFFIFLSFTMWSGFHGFRDYAQAIGCPMRPWTLVLLPGMRDYFVIIMLTFVLLVANAPFRTRQQQFILQRVGKKAWIEGQLLYLFLTSLIFAVVLWVLSWTFFLPELEWKAGWGPAIQTAAQTSANAPYTPGINFRYSIIKNASALGANAWCFLMIVLTCFLLSELIALCNLWTRSSLGTILAVALVMLSYVICFMSRYVGVYRFFLWVSPVSWMDRSMMGHTNQNLPSFAYGLGMSVFLCVLLAAILIGTIHKCNLETEKE